MAISSVSIHCPPAEIVASRVAMMIHDTFVKPFCFGRWDMKRFLIKCVLLVLVLGGLIYAYTTDRVVFDRPDRKVAHYTDRMGEKLAEENGLLMLLTFDQSAPRDWVSGAEIIQSGVEAVPGPIGTARRFDGHQRTFLETSVDWMRLSDSFTISTWVRLDPERKDQEILFSRTRRHQAGLKLDRGRMAFFVPAHNRPQSVDYPFERYGEFVHLVAVADMKEGRARLYENGILRASGAIDELDPPYANIEFGKRAWRGVRHPLKGDLGETAVWERALSDGEVTSLYRSRRSLLRTLQPWTYHKWRLADSIQRSIREALKWVDHFHPGLHEGRLHAADLPEINLFLSNSDRRHFNRAHRDSLATGRRVKQAASMRSIEYVFEGRAGDAELLLAGSNIRYAPYERPSFVLNIRNGPDIMGMHRIRFAPPESEGLLHPLLESRLAEKLNIPSVRTGLCRLLINGEPMGLYYYEEYSQKGVFPGNGSSFPFGPALPRDWHSLFRESGFPEPSPRLPVHGPLPISEDELFELYDELDRKTRTLFINDTRSSLSSREISHRLKWDRRSLLERWPLMSAQWGAARRTREALNEFMVLGSNRSPFYLTDDLDLNVWGLPGVTMEWTSSNPDVLTAEGRVTRPPGDYPVGAELTVSIADERETLETVLSFRVMPEHIRIPALMVYVNEHVKKSRRVDAVIEYLEPGLEIRSRRFAASQRRRGGISHRGHTGYWNPRKAFSIRFDEPHHLLDSTHTRHLHLINAPRDPALVRNKLSYDLFRAFGSDEAPRYAPRVQWVELFINGRYHCLIEMTTRVDRHMMGFDSHDPADHNGAVLYKRENLRYWTVGQPLDMRAIYPPRRYDHSFEPYHQLVDLIADAPAERFAREFETWMDLDNLIDFQILLNVTENRNGWPFRYVLHDILAREPGSDGRFFHVPWDFDATFEARQTWYANRMYRRLQADYPGFAERMHARWQELRTGPLCVKGLMDRLDEMESELAGYVEWEYDRWGYNNERSHEELVGDVREHIRARIAFLDEEMARRAAGDATGEDQDFDAVDDEDDYDEDA